MKIPELCERYREIHGGHFTARCWFTILARVYSRLVMLAPGLNFPLATSRSPICRIVKDAGAASIGWWWGNCALSYYTTRYKYFPSSSMENFLEETFFNWSSKEKKFGRTPSLCPEGQGLCFLVITDIFEDVHDNDEFVIVRCGSYFPRSGGDTSASKTFSHSVHSKSGQTWCKGS